MTKWARVAILLVLTLPLVWSCAGDKVFHEYARAGGTVAVAAGWKHHFDPSNITVTITPPGGVPTIYSPGDTRVRAVVNLYPDPLASMIISRETDQDLTPFARTYASTTANFTVPNGSSDSDKDWWQTVVFVDLPVSLPVGGGATEIMIDNPEGETARSTVEIVAPDGSTSSFDAESVGPLSAEMLASLKRVGHYTVSLDGAVLPYAVQVELTHDPDADNGGVGRAYVVNPLGYIKNLSWNDDGATMKIVLLPARDGEITVMHDFKFYVAGGVTNLTVNSVQAFDIDGYPVGGITASIAP